MNKLKSYRCKSKVASWGILFKECPYNCVVKTEFIPRACLHTPAWEDWEEVEEEEEGEVNEPVSER